MSSRIWRIELSEEGRLLPRREGAPDLPRLPAPGEANELLAVLLVQSPGLGIGFLDAHALVGNRANRGRLAFTPQVSGRVVRGAPIAGPASQLVGPLPLQQQP